MGSSLSSVIAPLRSSIRRPKLHVGASDVGVAVGVAVAVDVGVAVRVGVAVGVSVGVGV